MAARTLKALDDPTNPWDAASEEVDKMVAIRKAYFAKEQQERAAMEAQVAEKLAAQKAAIESGEGPKLPELPKMPELRSPFEGGLPKMPEMPQMPKPQWPWNAPPKGRGE